MVDMMDIASKQVCVETKFVELSERASKKLGIRWDSLDEFGVKLQAGPFTHSRDTAKNTDRSNTRTSSDNARQGTTDNASQSTFDTSSRNVQGGSTRTTTQRTQDGEESAQDYDSADVPMDRTITTVDANGVVTVTTLPTRTVTSGGSTLQNNGESFSDISGASVGRNSTTAKSQNNSTDRAQGYTTTDMDGFTRSIVDSQAAIMEVDSLNLVLSALKQTAGVQVVSNPKIIVTSGSTNAMFNVGSREPIIKTSVTRGNAASGQGDLYSSELDTGIDTEFIRGGYLETGISLKVVPVVKTDDMIQAQIWPRLSRTDAAKAKMSADGVNSWPFIQVKEIKTDFTLRSGQTVAIGGLTDTTDSKAVTKIPLLGDLPLIGKYLFSHTEDVKSQVETIIFVTLSRAEPEDLREKAGIPDDSELIHKRMIQRKMRQDEFGQELKAFETAAEADQARKARSGITKPRK
jgi:type II secretory pathway component GspD/PulD (secretin)